MDYLITAAVDYDYSIFLKSFANSLRINSPDANLLVRCINFEPDIELFRKQNFYRTSFYYDKVEFLDKRQKESYSMNVEFKTIYFALKNSNFNTIIFSDVDILVRNNLKLLTDKCKDVDIAFTYDDDNKNIATSFLIIKNNDKMKTFFKDVSEQADKLNLKNNFGDQSFFTKIFNNYKEITKLILPQTFCDVDCNENEILWNGRGWRKFSHPIYRKEFLKYLES